MIKKEQLDVISLNERLQRKHGKIVVIVSPPRCASTALARFFWHQPDFRYYAHEPYETVYYNGDRATAAEEHLLTPIDLPEIYPVSPTAIGNGLIIKEMPYQVGTHFSDLAALATLPLLFLIRDPRLNIKSRIDKKALAGQPTNFPQEETGWNIMEKQIEFCEQTGTEFILVEASEMRNFPVSTFAGLSKKLALPFSPNMLCWQPATQINLDNLQGKHSHLYERVLRSSGIEPATEPIPELASLPSENGLRDHVAEALLIYQKLACHPKRLRVDQEIR